MDDASRPEPDTAGREGTDALQVVNIAKLFGALTALRDVNLRVS